MLSRVQECIKDFLEIYNSEPCLWQTKNKDYHDREKRAAAYERLVEKLCEIEPRANKESVVKKINNIRSTYRKECKKVKKSQKSGSKEAYVPRLWYFKMLSFLKDEQNPRKTRPNTESGGDDDDDDDDKTGITEHSVQISSGTCTPEVTTEDAASESPISTRDENTLEPTPVTATSTTQSNRPRPPKRNPSQSTSDLANKTLLSVNNHCKRPAGQEDRFDVFGKSVAMKLRDLPKEQRLMAEKIINDTLFEAELGNLSIPRGFGPPTPQQYQLQILPCYSATLNQSFPILSTPSSTIQTTSHPTTTSPTK